MENVCKNFMYEHAQKCLQTFLLLLLACRAPSKWIVSYIRPITSTGRKINIAYFGFQGRHNSSCKLFQYRYGLVQGYYTLFSSMLQQGRILSCFLSDEAPCICNIMGFDMNKIGRRKDNFYSPDVQFYASGAFLVLRQLYKKRIAECKLVLANQKFTLLC